MTRGLNYCLVFTGLAAVLVVALSVAGCGEGFESPGDACDRHYDRCVELYEDNYRAEACRDNYALCMTQTSTGTV